jgi:thioredoxin reductase
MNKRVDIAIIGGGPAGMAAAVSCWEKGIKNILIIERDDHLGGILQQCIHHGFGIERFKEALTGPEYAQRFIDEIEQYKIPFLLETMVLNISNDKEIVCVNSEQGILHIQATSVILAMGCRERTQGALQMAGYRPAGVYPAGMAQKLVNLHGWMPGKNIVILGSGDIGLIMARRMVWEGANVKMVCELMPHSAGLARNIHQCLHDNDIPLKLSHTVTKIHGKERITGVTIAKVDDKLKPIKESEQLIACDCLLLSVGLIPENELSIGMGVDMDQRTNGLHVDEQRQTNISGVFACGNVLHVHDIVDYVSDEAEIAGKSAAQYVQKEKITNQEIEIKVEAGNGIRYTVPQVIHQITNVPCYFRTTAVYHQPVLEVKSGKDVLLRKPYIKLTPGEMGNVLLTQQILEKATHQQTITIEIIEKEK